MLKRLFDIMLSFFGLIILSPIMLMIALAIAIESRGGIFYTQKRVGKNNRDFKLIKFRSMTMGSENKGLLTVGHNDSRITKTGAVIRKYKLDELPQLFNVLKGDMSLVGPRPEVRKYVDLYTKAQMKVLSVKPGITDDASIEYFEENKILAQSKHPEKTYIEDVMPHKLKLNQKYLENQNLLHDLRIIFKTFEKIFKWK